MSGAARSAAIVAIGDELVRGERVDAHVSWLAARLASQGFEVREARLLGDDEASIAAALAELLAGTSLVIATGGIGPTLDDVTRHAAARAAGLELVLDDDALALVRSWWEQRGRPMPASNERQALLPRGATVLANAHGTAPGFRLAGADAWLVVLPGPPNEMRGVFADQVEPWLATLPAAGEVRRARSLLFFGLSESLFADRAADWMERGANPRLGVLASGGALLVRVEARARDAADAGALLDARLLELRERFGAHLAGDGEASLAELAGAALRASGMSVALAESCTGGLVAARLTEVPGISEVFREGFVTYSNAAKEARLGVPREVLDAHGAVSEETARAMARGAAERAGARLGLSVTGIAGPGGGGPEKPVGLVWFGLALDGEARALERRFPPRSRELVREWAANTALDLLRRAALEGSLARLA